MTFGERACEGRSRSEVLNASFPVPDGSKRSTYFKKLSEAPGIINYVSNEGKPGEGVT